MLTFLRKVRKSLIDSGSTRRYLIYAVGEILLVMIGILLALQVNNWNENNKLRKYEISSLKDIKSDLLVSAENLKLCNNTDSLFVRNYDIILAHIQNSKPYHDSLKDHFAELIEWATPTFSTGAYESLKSSKGLDVISNNSLRKEIIFIHETRYSINLDRYEREEAMVHQELMLPVFSDLFSYIWTESDKGAVPINYNDLLGNSKFINVLNLTRKYRISSFFAERDTYDRIQKLVKQIDKEIQRLEN